jgi:hypothetical protein
MHSLTPWRGKNMHSHLNINIFLLSILLLNITLASAENSHSAITVRNVSELLKVQALIAKRSPKGISPQMVINVEPNTYVLTDTFRINRSNVCLIAEPGTKAILADNINKPVLAIGSQEEIPSYTIENICVSGVEIDGNKDNQDSELDADMSWIRNNGIDVRAVKRLSIDNVVSNNNRSGGLVVSWGSSDIHVSNSEFDENYYDGIAYYDSERIYTHNSSMKNNNSAGISLDNDLRDSITSVRKNQDHSSLTYCI